MKEYDTVEGKTEMLVFYCQRCRKVVSIQPSVSTVCPPAYCAKCKEKIDKIEIHTK